MGSIWGGRDSNKLFAFWKHLHGDIHPSCSLAYLHAVHVHLPLDECRSPLRYFVSFSVSLTDLILCHIFKHLTCSLLLNRCLVTLDFAWYHIGILCSMLLDKASLSRHTLYFFAALTRTFRSSGSQELLVFHDCRKMFILCSGSTFSSDVRVWCAMMASAAYAHMGCLGPKLR